MIKTLTKSNFRDEFKNCGRENQFSYDALGALYDFFEDLDDQSGTGTELDVIAICCEFTEYEDLEDFRANYGVGYETMEDIKNNTIVIPVNDESFIIQDF